MRRKLLGSSAARDAAHHGLCQLAGRADLRAFDPVEVAQLETAMWRDCYEKRYPALFYHLYGRYQPPESPARKRWPIVTRVARRRQSARPGRDREPVAAGLPAAEAGHRR